MILFVKFVEFYQNVILPGLCAEPALERLQVG